MPRNRQYYAASPNLRAGYAILHHHCSTGKTPLDSVLLTNLVLRYWFHDSGLVLRLVIARIPGLTVAAAYNFGHIQPLSCPHTIKLPSRGAIWLRVRGRSVALITRSLLSADMALHPGRCCESPVAFGVPNFTSYNQAMSTIPAATRIADHRRCTDDGYH